MERLRLWLALIRWDKPVGSLLLLWPSLSALWIASNGRPDWWLVVVFIAGTFLMRSAGCAVNDVADQDFDRAVRRTAQRPVTAGRVSTREALAVGAVLALVAFGLVLTTNALTIQMSVAALLIAIAYPWTKRWLAFAAARGEVPMLAWVLLLGNLFWVLAYDTEYAMVDRDDDLKVGIKTSAITFGRADVAAVMASYSAFIAIWAAVGWALRLGWPYFLGVAAAAAQAAHHYTLIRSRDPAQCFRAFRLNHYLGLALFVGTVAAYALR
jgi:4-hydroxybenzoate polyprenyltransferase